MGRKTRSGRHFPAFVEAIQTWSREFTAASTHTQWMEESRNRSFPCFSSRLIRSDLADNWNIDVAAELEEYLEDLESVMISFDGGKSNLNFAEAALMIQVSNRLQCDA